MEAATKTKASLSYCSSSWWGLICYVYSTDLTHTEGTSFPGLAIAARRLGNEGEDEAELKSYFTYDIFHLAVISHKKEAQVRVQGEDPQRTWVEYHFSRGGLLTQAWPRFSKGHQSPSGIM